ncbi:hypothetical protein CEXT_218311 [Caerostris extrusa]|uniref:Uncharacterized protein n=1 Tax=Caerostris extrusa TaxID=172846 RepID=A0AAV4UIT8_CAEEX|nr:hypothetical protein CEXT_218311 [Caerostris extrusa]
MLEAVRLLRPLKGDRILWKVREEFYLSCMDFQGFVVLRSIIGSLLSGKDGLVKWILLLKISLYLCSNEIDVIDLFKRGTVAVAAGFRLRIVQPLI